MVSFNSKLIISVAIGGLFSFGAGAISPTIEGYLYRWKLPAGAAGFKDLQTLFGAGCYDDAITKGENILERGNQGVFGPQILFICWRASEAMSRPAQADQFQTRLFKLYPENSTCADLLFSAAVNAISARHVAAALPPLRVINKEYPKSTVYPFASMLLDELNGVGDNMESQLGHP